MNRAKGLAVLLKTMELADDATGRLLARGIPPACLPGRDQLLLPLWPLARKLVKSQKLAPECAEAHQFGMRYDAQVRARPAEAVDALIAMWARAGAEHRSVQWERLTDFDPARWQVTLQPAAVARRAA